METYKKLLKGEKVSKKELKSVDEKGNNALHYATKKANLKIVKKLIKSGINVDIRNNELKTPLNFAVELYSDNVDDIDLEDYFEVFDYLLEHGADIDSKDKFGNTPLHFSIKDDSFTDLVEYLIEHGADVKAKNEKGDTPLHEGVAFIDITEMLINAGSDINAVDDTYGYTPLHMAAEMNSETIEYLIENGAEINAADKKGNTPLHLLANTGGDDDLLIYLIDHGADTDIRNKEGKNPLDLMDEMTSKGAIDYIKAKNLLKIVFLISKKLQTKYFGVIVLESLISQLLGEDNIKLLKDHAYLHIFSDINEEYKKNNLILKPFEDLTDEDIETNKMIKENIEEYRKYNAENIIDIIVAIATQDKYMNSREIPKDLKKIIKEYISTKN